MGGSMLHEAASVVGHVHFPGFSSAAGSKIQINLIPPDKVLIPSHAHSALSTYLILYSFIRTPCGFYLDRAVRRLGLHHMAYRNENLKTPASHTAMPPLRSTPKTLRRLCGTSLATSSHTGRVGSCVSICKRTFNLTCL